MKRIILLLGLLLFLPIVTASPIIVLTQDGLTIEEVEDITASLMKNTANIEWFYNDGSGTLEANLTSSILSEIFNKFNSSYLDTFNATYLSTFNASYANTPFDQGLNTTDSPTFVTATFTTSVVSPSYTTAQDSAIAITVPTVSSGAGKDLTLTSGDGAGISGAGGDIIFTPGAASGLAADGVIKFLNPVGSEVASYSGTAIVFNEGGQSAASFRVESSSNLNMFKLSASSNIVDIADVKILNTAIDSDNINVLIDTPGVITQGAGFLGTPGYRWLQIRENGVNKLWIDDSAGGAVRFYAQGRMDFESAGQLFFQGTTLFFGATSIITRIGDASSTATQKGSKGLAQQVSLWTGSSQTKRYHYMRGIASTTENLVSKLAIFMNSTQTTNIGGVEMFSILNTGEVKIGNSDFSRRGQLEVVQKISTEGLPVLYLNQTDVSEEFVRFVGTAASATITNSLVDDGDVASSTLIGWLEINIQDEGNQITDGSYYIPFYTLT